MRKFTAFTLVLLVCALICTLVVGCDKQQTESENELAAATGEATELEFLYVSDTHYMSEEEIGDYNYESFKQRELSAQKMNFISEAMFKQFCDQVKASGVKMLLIGGDINESGSLSGHVEIAAHLKDLEDAGVTVYVVPGNHDCNGSSSTYTSSGSSAREDTTNEKFAEIYADFGYTDTNRFATVASDMDVEGSLSYSVDLNDKYTLIALDNASYDSEDTSMDAINWVTAEIEKAVEADKTPLVMAHEPLMEIFTGVSSIADIKISGEFVKEQNAAIGKTWYEKGLKYYFTGHMHSNDLMMTDYDDEDDEIGILQFMNTTLTDYDCSYHDVRFTENYVDFTQQKLSAPKESYLPAYLNATDKTSILTDWENFTYEFTKDDFANKIYILKDTIKAYLVKFGFGNDYAALSATDKGKVDAFVDGLFAYLDSPLYAHDEQSGQTSLETLLKGYNWNGQLPASDYDSVLDVILDIVVRSFAAGNYALDADGAHWKLVKYAIYGLVAQLEKGGLFALMSDMGLEVEQKDCAPMITELLNTGLLDLYGYNVVDNLLHIAVINSLDSTIRGIVLSLSGEDFLYILPGLFSLVQGLIGVDLSVYFPIDEAATASNMEENNLEREDAIVITGKLNIDALMDEYVFNVVGKGLFYNDLSVTTTAVFNRNTGVAYDK